MEKTIIVKMSDLGTPPYLIAKILSIPEGDVDEALDEFQDTLEQIEEKYYAEEWGKVRQGLSEFVMEIPESERREMRRNYLLSQIKLAKENLDPVQAKRLLTELKIFTGEIVGVSHVMIEKARQYPLSSLVKMRGGMARCPFHADSSPSLDVRKNFYFCYGCGAKGDVIDFVMKTKFLSFKEAVNYLS